jgi:hypothetical protein
MTAEEAKIAVTDYIAYFGSYTIDGKAGTVTHHRQTSIQPGRLRRFGAQVRVRRRSPDPGIAELETGDHL